MDPYVYRTRLFRPGSDEGPHEPPIRPDSVGVALSGGGSRSLVASMGQLRGLRHTGLLGRVWGISSASGGTWAAVPYVYLPETVDEETFLGPVVADPGELTWFGYAGRPEGTALDRVEHHNLGKAARHLGILHLIEEALRLIDRGLPPEESWPMSIGHKVLQPFGLYDGDALGQDDRYFTWSEESYRRDVEELNPGRASLARDRFRFVARSERPFLIVNTALVPRRDHSDLLPFEITPLSAGPPGFFPRAGPGERDIGGGAVSPFALGSTGPRLADDASVDATRPVRPFSLADMAGLSSVAPAEMLQQRVPAFDAMIPSKMIWPVLGFDEPRNSTWPYLFADGGSLENTAVIALLRRPLPRIVSFLNCETPLRRDPVTREVVVDPMLPPLFGYRPHVEGRSYVRYVDSSPDDAGTSVFRFNQVFDSSSFFPAIEGLWEAAEEGGAAAFRQRDLEVLANERFGVEGGRRVDVLWVYNHRARDFTRRLSLYVRLGMALPFSGMHHFPRYGTTLQMRLHPRQINLLAHLAAWTVIDPSGRVASMFESSNRRG